MAALYVSDLCKAYRDRTVLDHVGFRVQPGEIVGLLGPNGAGKTTTIKCCLGLIEPDEGRIEIDGVDARKDRNRALGRVGAVLEGNRNVFWRLSVLENLVLFANLAGVPTSLAKQRATELLERFALAPRMHSRVAELSRGMQQKVAVCAALIRNPAVLFLDEPTLGLDVETANELEDVLRALVKEERRAILITSHQMELVQSLCERVIIIQSGRVVVDQRVQDLLELFDSRSYRITTEEPLPAAAVTQLLALFPSASVDSTSVTITVSHGRMLYDAMQILQNAGCVIRTVEHQSPDLAEVFLHYVRRGLAS